MYKISCTESFDKCAGVIKNSQVTNCNKLRSDPILYSLFQKKRTFNSDFFRDPPEEGGPKIHMVYYVNGSSTHAQFFLLKNLQPF